MPPIWVDLVDQVDDDVKNVKKLMKDLTALHGERVSSVFDRGDMGSRDREIQDKTDLITKKLRHAEKVLKDIGKAEEPGKEVTDSDVKVRTAIQMSMAKKIQELSMEFRKQQKTYLADVQRQKGGGDNQQFGLELKDDFSMVDTGFNAQQMAVMQNLEGIVNERDEEIQKIAKSIEELSNIFKELSVLIIDQGTILDRIDYNMEQTVEHVKEGIQELEQAEELQKSARATKCIIALLLLITIMMTVLIVKHTSSSRK